jgi:hypothetical protein
MMSEILDHVDYAPASAPVAEQDVVEIIPAVEGPERWHDYSVERGNEGSLLSSSPNISIRGLSRDYAQASWNFHGFRLG